MRYVWDPAKDVLNQRKHGLSLAEGIPALEDPDRDSWIDDRFDYGEERIVTLGMNLPNVLYVVSTEWDEETPALSQSERRSPMKLKDMISVTHNPGDPPIKTNTDWAAIDALTDEQLHAAALSDPDSQPFPLGTDEELAKLGLHRIPNVKKLRERLDLTQEAFAATYRIPIGTLRDWEQGRKLPDAPARAYLTVISRNPEAVAGLLGEAA